MGDMFQPTTEPTQTTSTTTSSSEMPFFLQQAIARQINTAATIANQEYTDYDFDRLAPLTDYQNTALSNVLANQGNWETGLGAAETGIADLGKTPGQVAAQKDYFDTVSKMSGVAAAQPSLDKQTTVLSGLQLVQPELTLSASQNAYISPTVAEELRKSGQDIYTKAGALDIAGSASPYLTDAAKLSGVAGAQPSFTAATDILGHTDYNVPVSGLTTQQSKYLSPDLADTMLQSGQKYYDAASGMDIAGAASPYLTSAAKLSGVAGAQPSLAAAADILGKADYSAPAAALAAQQGKYLSPELAASTMSEAQRALLAAKEQSIIGAANPYLSAAAKSSAAAINQYMNPYQSAVADQIASLGARNLQEKLLPAVSDAFIRAGQFGGSRMGEFGSRALRDAQEAILNQQSQALQQGYGQALSASQADLARQAQLASTTGQLTGQQQAALSNIGQIQAGISQQQQQAGISAAQQTAAAQQQALSQALQGAGLYQQIGQNLGQLTQAQQQALINIGQTGGQLTGQQMSQILNLAQSQTAAGQAQQQAGLTAAQQTAAAQQQAIAQGLQGAGLYQQIGQNLGQLTQAQQQALINIGQTGGQLTGQQLSALTALGQAQTAAGQAQQQFGLTAAKNVAETQQQALSQGLQQAGQYGALASTIGGLTADQQRILAGLGTSAATAAGADVATQMGAFKDLAALAEARQSMAAKDVSALEAAGQEKQLQQQKELDLGYQEKMDELLYNQRQADWFMGQIRGLAPIIPQQATTSNVATGTTAGPSPLAQVAGVLAGVGGIKSLMGG